MEREGKLGKGKAFGNKSQSSLHAIVFVFLAVVLFAIAAAEVYNNSEFNNSLTENYTNYSLIDDGINLSLSDESNISTTNESFVNGSEIFINASDLFLNESNTFSNEPLGDSFDQNVSKENEKVINISDKTREYYLQDYSLLAYSDNGSLLQNVNDCGVLNTTNAVYTLTQSVVSNLTCFNITANNITLDGAGFTVNYSAIGTLGYGVNVLGINFTTIKNMRVVEGSSTNSNKWGIYFLNARNGTIQNNSITTSGTTSFGIYLLTSANNNSVLNNLINTSGTSSYGVYISSSNNELFSNNTIITSGTSGYAFYFVTSTGNNLTLNSANTSQTSGYVFSGTVPSSFNSSLDTSNLAEGKPVAWTFGAVNSNDILTNISEIGATESVYTNALLGLYHLNNYSAYGENTTRVYDFSGNGNNGTVSGGAVWNSSGKLNGAYTLDGNNDFVDLNQTGLSSASMTGRTVSMWVKWNALISNKYMLIDEIGTGWWRFALGVSVGACGAGYQPSFTTRDSSSGDTGTVEELCSSLVPSAGQWYNIVVTYDSTSASKKIYINGVLNASTGTSVDAFTSTASGAVTIGADRINSARYFNGSIDEVAIWNRSLSASEIQNIYRKQAGDFGQITCASCSNITYSNLNIVDGDGINLFNTSNSFVNNCSINTSKSHGIWMFSSSHNNLIFNNTIVTSTAGERAGILFSSTSNNNSAYSNIITTSGTGGYGIWFTTSNNQIFNNTITTSGTTGYGIYLSSASSNNQIFNNTITASGNNGHGIYLSSAVHNVFFNNTIITSGTTGYGLWFASSTNNNSFSGMIIRTNNTNGYSIDIYDTNHNFTIWDSILNSSSAVVKEIYVTSAVKGGTWNFTNVTRSNGQPINVSWTAGANGTLNMRWYADVNALVNQSSSGIIGANLYLWDVNGAQVIDNDVSGIFGNITRKTLLEYNIINNSAGGNTKTYYSPYTVNASRFGFDNYTNSTINLSTNLIVNAMMNDLMPSINFTGQTVSNGTASNINSFYVNVSSSDDYGDHYVFTDLDNSLIARYGFEQGNGTFFSDMTGKNNGTCSGTTCPIYNSSGRFGGAWTFDGVGDYINVTDRILNYSSFSLWFKTNTSGEGVLIGAFESNTNRVLSVVNSGHLCFASITSGQSTYTSGTYSDGLWHHVVVNITNSTHSIFYIDGTLATTTQASCGRTSQKLLIGARWLGSASIFFNGSLDEVMIFNRTLSLGEIQSLYNASANKYYNNFTDLSNGTHTYTSYVIDASGNRNSTAQNYYIVDLTLPNSTLISPENNSYSNLTSFNFTANVSDNVGLMNATLYLYNSTGLFSSIGAVISGVSATIGNVISNLVNGVYTWFYSIFDSAGNRYDSANNTLNVDTVYPVIAFDSLTPQNNSGRSGVFWINVTVNETNLANISLTFTDQADVICNRSSLSNALSCNNLNASVYNTSSNDWIFLFNKSGLTSGNLYYYYSTAIDIAGNINSTFTRVIKGNAAPFLGSLNFTPSSNDSIDPGTVVIVESNITDNEGNMGSAILEWVNSTQSWNSANRILMTNTTTINSTNFNTTFIANFTTPSYQDTLFFRIYVNDTPGESTNLSVYTFGNKWDCTWSVNPSDLGVVGGYAQEKELGNISFANTGDVQYGVNNCTLFFARTSSGSAWYTGSGYAKNGEYLNISTVYYLQEDVADKGKGIRYYYNGSVVSGLLLSPGQNKTLELRGEFVGSNSVLNEYLVVPIFSNITHSENGMTNVTAYSHMIVTPGAYLSLGIEQSLDTSAGRYLISLTPSNSTFRGYVKNVVDSVDNPQNNTAYNISFNWNVSTAIQNLLEAGYSLNSSYEILNDTNKQYNNITVSFTSANLAGFIPGVYNFTVYSFGYENSSGNFSLITYFGNQTLLSQSIEVNFTCYSGRDDILVSACGVSDGDYYALGGGTNTVSASSGGGGSGGGVGVGGSSGGSKFIREEKQFELVRGKQNSFSVDFQNPSSTQDLHNISISLTGLLADYISVTPEYVSSLSAGKSVKITAEITAPKYISEGRYALNLKISGVQGAGGATVSISEQKQIILYIYDISREEAKERYSLTEEWVSEMKSSNFTVSEVEKLFVELKEGFNRTDFAVVNKKYLDIKTIFDNAIGSEKLIRDLRDSMDDARLNGIQTPETNKLVNLAESAFIRGDYSLAMARLKEAQLSFALETKGEFNLGYFIIRNPGESAGIALLTFLFVTSTTLLVKRRLLKSKLKLLSEEEVLLIGLMKVVQKQCFEEAKMSMEEYQNTMSQYEERLNKVIQERISAESKLLNLMKIRGGKKKALREESERLKELIKKTQKMYFEDSKIETRVYENIMKSYTGKLSEVEENLATIEANEALKGAGFGFKFKR